MANVCKPKHMIESAAWFWKSGRRSCSEIAKGNRYYGPKSKKGQNPCWCDLSHKAVQWNAKWDRNAQGNVEYDSNGEPKKGKCVYEKKSGKCGKLKNIEKDMTADEVWRVAGASRCINGAYCYHLEERAQQYRHVRDFLAKTPAEKASYCSRRK
jgi:hypothetical protein